MKKIILLLISMISLMSSAAEKSNYFRVWQGFKNNNLNQVEFIDSLPNLIQATIDYYSCDVLNSYIVIIPPKYFPNSTLEKPNFIPDELALIGLRSKDDYDRLKVTDEGIQYMNMHGPIFQRGLSKSSKFVKNFDFSIPTESIDEITYNMIQKPIDWSQGYNTVFIGVKKDSLSHSEFQVKLHNHIELALKLMPQEGLNGYIVIANKDYEIAYLNWTSKDIHEKALISANGKQVFNDAQNIMDVLMYENAEYSHVVSDIKYGFSKSYYPRCSSLEN